MDRVIHFEIPAEDVPRAKAFYSNVFDWEMVAPPGNDYVIIDTASADPDNVPIWYGPINGSMVQRENGISSPVLYIEVEDIDFSIWKVGMYGGQIVSPKRLAEESGWTCYAKDTEGNVMALWQPIRQQAEKPKFEPITVSPMAALF